jgi:hypothetical protein
MEGCTRCGTIAFLYSGECGQCYTNPQPLFAANMIGRRMVRAADLPAHTATAKNDDIEMAKLPAGLVTGLLRDKIWAAYYAKGSCLTLEEAIAIYKEEEKQYVAV